MHSRSASWVANQSKKPLRAAERTPLALKLMMRMGEEPGLGIGDWGLGIGDWGLGVGDWGMGRGDGGFRIRKAETVMWFLDRKDRKSKRLKSSHKYAARMPYSARKKNVHIHEELEATSTTASASQ